MPCRDDLEHGFLHSPPDPKVGPSAEDTQVLPDPRNISIPALGLKLLPHRRHVPCVQFLSRRLQQGLSDVLNLLPLIVSSRTWETFPFTRVSMSLAFSLCVARCSLPHLPGSCATSMC